MTRTQTIRESSKSSQTLGAIAAWSLQSIQIDAERLAKIGERHGIAARNKTWWSAYDAAWRMLVTEYDAKGVPLYCKELETDEKTGVTAWQISREKDAKVDGRKAIENDYECFIDVNYSTGKAESQRNPKLAAELQKLAAVEMTIRRTQDVTKMLDSAFKGIDLVPLRDAGGAYFVFAKDVAAVDKAASFITEVAQALGKSLSTDAEERADCKFLRFDFPATPANKASAAEAWTGYVGNLIAEYQAVIADFDVEKVRAGTLEAMAEKIKSLKGRIEAHADIMVVKGEETRKALDAATKALAAKINGAKVAEDRKAAKKPAKKSA